MEILKAVSRWFFYGIGVAVLVGVLWLMAAPIECVIKAGCFAPQDGDWRIFTIDMGLAEWIILLVYAIRGLGAWFKWAFAGKQRIRRRRTDEF